MWINDSNRPLHILYGLIVYLIAGLFCWLIGLTVTQIAATALFVVTAVATTLEYKDWLYGNNFDLLDLLATVAGPMITTLIITVI